MPRRAGDSSWYHSNRMQIATWLTSSSVLLSRQTKVHGAAESPDTAPIAADGAKCSDSPRRARRTSGHPQRTQKDVRNPCDPWPSLAGTLAAPMHIGSGSGYGCCACVYHVISAEDSCLGAATRRRRASPRREGSPRDYQQGVEPTRGVDHKTRRADVTALEPRCATRTTRSGALPTERIV